MSGAGEAAGRQHGRAEDAQDHASTIGGDGDLASLWPVVRRLAAGVRFILVGGGSAAARAAVAYAIAAGHAREHGAAELLRIGTPPDGMAQATADAFVAGLLHREIFAADLGGVLRGLPHTSLAVALLGPDAPAMRVVMAQGAGVILINHVGTTPARELANAVQAARDAAAPVLGIVQFYDAQSRMRA